MRFLVAGLVLYGWMRVRRIPSPTAREWGAASLLAILTFVFDYGLLFCPDSDLPPGALLLSDFRKDVRTEKAEPKTGEKPGANPAPEGLQGGLPHLLWLRLASSGHCAWRRTDRKGR